MRKSKYNKGATLIEALVAVMILVLGVLPSLSTILLANSFASIIKNNLIAANLAQEGAEVVRAIRDANWFTGQPFDAGLANGNYTVSWNSTSLTPDTSQPVLKLSSSGLYNYSTGTDTTFKRRISITKIDPTGCNCELRILTEVSWEERRRTEIIVIESHLFDWN